MWYVICIPQKLFRKKEGNPKEGEGLDLLHTRTSEAGLGLCMPLMMASSNVPGHPTGFHGLQILMLMAAMNHHIARESSCHSLKIESLGQEHALGKPRPRV